MTDLSAPILFLLAFLAMTSFAKSATVLSILRMGLGLRGAGFGAVVMVLSLVIAIASAQPGLRSDLGTADSSQGGLSDQLVALEDTLAPFLNRHTDPRIQEQIARLGGSGTVAAESQSASQPILLRTLSFLITELGEAFKIGFLLLLPFLAIDLLTANVVSSLGMTLHYQVIALPAKLFLFMLVDGWFLVTQRLLLTYTSS